MVAAMADPKGHQGKNVPHKVRDVGETYLTRARLVNAYAPVAGIADDLASLAQ